jgi:hypothetical protein
MSQSKRLPLPVTPSLSPQEEMKSESGKIAERKVKNEKSNIWFWFFMFIITRCLPIDPALRI